MNEKTELFQSLFFIWVVIPALCALVAFFLYIRDLGDRARRRMWQVLAVKYQMRYRHKDRYAIPYKFDFALFQEGKKRRAFNCLDGLYQELPVVLFDYRYVTGRGNQEEIHDHSALLARLNIRSRKLIIRPERAIDRLAALIGIGDIQFEFEQFNRTFNVQCDDKKFAYHVCHPEMMEFILKYRSLTWELEGNHLLIYFLKDRFDEQSVAVCLEAASGFAKRIPQYLQVEEGV